MDRSAAPWRVLEEPAGHDGVDSLEPGRPDVRAGPLANVGWGTIAGIIAAAALAAAAFLVAATGPAGGVAADTTDGETGGSRLGASVRPDASSRSPGAAVASEIVVDVQGAVVEPGVQHLPEGSRVADAVDAAGGYGPRVDAGRAGRELNLAAILKDGDRVVVPSRDDPPAPPAGGGTPGAGGPGGEPAAGPVDLNTATLAELDALPGIGPVTAQKILDARAEQPFASVDDLRDRKIVGASTFEKVRDLVVVR